MEVAPVENDTLSMLIGALPTLGPVGMVLLILGYVVKQWLNSDARYRAELQRMSEAHDIEMKEVREELKQVKQELNDLRNELQEERRLRFQAQEEAHNVKLMMLGKVENVSERFGEGP